MYKVSVLLVLVLCGAVVGCDTGTTKENVSTTGWTGQKVGQNPNVSGPVPSSSTGTTGYLQNPQPKPPQDPPPVTQNLDSD